MFPIKNTLFIFVSIFAFCIFSTAVFGQRNQSFQPVTKNDGEIFQNLLLLNADDICRAENLNRARFEPRLSIGQQLLFCEKLQKAADNLNRNRTPALKAELRQIWRIFSSENIKIRQMEKNVSANVRAVAGAFDEKKTRGIFTAVCISDLTGTKMNLFF